MPRVDQYLFVNFKYALAATVIAYLLVMVYCGVKRLLLGKRASRPSAKIKLFLLPLVSLSFIGVVASLVWLTVGVHRLSSFIVVMEDNGDRTQTQDPKISYYLGYLDLSSLILSLKDKLEQKCKTVESILPQSGYEEPPLNYAVDEAIDYHSPPITPQKQFDGLSASLSQQDTYALDEARLKRQVSRLLRSTLLIVGNCSEKEKEYIAKSAETNDNILYMEKRFKNSVLIYAKKAFIIFSALLILTPVVAITLLYTLMKMRDSFNSVSLEAEHGLWTMVRKSFAVTVLLALLAAVFVFVLIQAVPYLNATADVKNMYAKRSRSQLKDSIRPLAVHRRNMQPASRLIKSFEASLLNLKEKAFQGLPNKNVKTTVKDQLQQAPETLSPSVEIIDEALTKIVSAHELVALQDDIEDTAKAIHDDIVRSDLRPLMQAHLQALETKLAQGLYYPLYAGLVTSVTAVLIQIVQILITA